jgi:Mn-containing catalase
LRYQYVHIARAVLADISTEMAHMEMIAVLVYKLADGHRPEENE